MMSTGLQPFQQVFSGGVISPYRVVALSSHTRDRNLEYQDPPRLALSTQDPRQIRALLDYAGITPERDSMAERFSIAVFQAARHFARRTHYERITFDWDHTLSNYQVFEDLQALPRVRLSRSRPTAHMQKPMSVVEGLRPFMGEIAFGLMVGFAQRQGLNYFDQWTDYVPQVGLMTMTWPDRLAVMSQHYIRLLPLMEGHLPGGTETAEVVRADQSRAFIHLHHFLNYADRLVDRYEQAGWAGLNESEQVSLMHYLEERKAHHRKPLAAVAAHGWNPSSLLHFDDDTRVIADVQSDIMYQGARAVFIPNTYTPYGRNVRETDKVLVSDLLREQIPGLGRSRAAKIETAARRLGAVESRHSSIHEILDVFRGSGDNPLLLGAQLVHRDPQLAGVILDRKTDIDGVIHIVHEMKTTLGSFWEQYVHPARQRQERLQGLVRADKRPS